MMDYESLARKYGYTRLFECDKVNQDFVSKLDNFFLNGGEFCNKFSTFGDNKRILEYLEYADSIDNQSAKNSEEIKKFDRELATWNKSI